MHEQIELSRDCPAIQIPEGTPVTIPQGTRVIVTQELGGSVTVMTDRGAMFRVDERNADALGREVAAVAEEEAASGPIEDRVWGQLRKCYDPEIPVNIVDLGLVYDCTVNETTPGTHDVHIQMTLTAPGCGMGPVLAQDVKTRLERMPDVESAEVEVVFDPPWNQNMMSEAARLQLGFF